MVNPRIPLVVPQLVAPLEDELDDTKPEEPDDAETIAPRPPLPPPALDDAPPVAVPVPLDAPVPLFLFPLPVLEPQAAKTAALVESSATKLSLKDLTLLEPRLHDRPPSNKKTRVA
jgi:hypothetical protein